MSQNKATREPTAFQRGIIIIVRIKHLSYISTLSDGAKYLSYDFMSNHRFYGHPS